MNRYGTTHDMIVQEIDIDGVTKLIAIDKKGLYLTTRDKVNGLLADVNRYGVSREFINGQLEEAGIDPFTMFNENKHRIKTETGAKAKALNPIKASKRNM